MSHRFSPFPKGKPIVELENVSIALGGTTILDDVSLSVACGERVVLIGPSGSGKSTLVRCMNGLVKPDHGRVRLFGENIRSTERWRTSRLRMEMIFQGFNLYSNLTVLENVTLAPMRLTGLPRPHAERLARDHLAALGVGALADRYPFQLSGGQQQRVALARALAKTPDILLLDEPTSALDPEMVQGALAAIEAATAKGMTTVTVTHEMGFARRQAHRVVFLEHGRIVEQGTPAALFDAPKSERLRRFLDHVLR